jgi:hypothetical protein
MPQPVPVIVSTQPLTTSTTAETQQPIVQGRRKLLSRARSTLRRLLHPADFTPQPGVNFAPLEDLVKSGRKMQQLVDQLDPFRRAGWREACAVEAAKTWRPYRLFNLTDAITAAPEYVQVLQGGDVVGVISDATAKLNRLRQQSPAMQPQKQEVVSQSGRK